MRRVSIGLAETRFHRIRTSTDDSYMGKKVKPIQWLVSTSGGQKDRSFSLLLRRRRRIGAGVPSC